MQTIIGCLNLIIDTTVHALIKNKKNQHLINDHFKLSTSTIKRMILRWIHILTTIMLHSPGRQIDTRLSSRALCYKAKECLTSTASLCWVGSLQTWACCLNAVWNIFLHTHYSSTLSKQWLPIMAQISMLDTRKWMLQSFIRTISYSFITFSHFHSKL